MRVHISCCIGNYNIEINELLCKRFTPNGGVCGGNYMGFQQARLNLLGFLVTNVWSLVTINVIVVVLDRTLE